MEEQTRVLEYKCPCCNAGLHFGFICTIPFTQPLFVISILLPPQLSLTGRPQPLRVMVELGVSVIVRNFHLHVMVMVLSVPKATPVISNISLVSLSNFSLSAVIFAVLYLFSNSFKSMFLSNVNLRKTTVSSVI